MVSWVNRTIHNLLGSLFYMKFLTIIFLFTFINSYEKMLPLIIFWLNRMINFKFASGHVDMSTPSQMLHSLWFVRNFRHLSVSWIDLTINITLVSLILHKFATRNVDMCNAIQMSHYPHWVSVFWNDHTQLSLKVHLVLQTFLHTLCQLVWNWITETTLSTVCNTSSKRTHTSNWANKLGGNLHLHIHLYAPLRT